MNILLTAFDPFGGETINPALEALSILPEEVGGHRLHKLAVPTLFGGAAELALAAMDRLRPEAVICLGQAGGRKNISVERVAVNLMDARITDNAGYRPVDQPVVPGGPAAYFSTLPVKAMAQAIRDAGLPGEVSYTAGTFVCNSLLYSVLHHAALHLPETRCAFIHVPYLPEQTGGKAEVFALPLADMVRGLTAAISAVDGTDQEEQHGPGCAPK